MLFNEWRTTRYGTKLWRETSNHDQRSVLVASLVYCRARDPFLSLWPIKLQVRARLNTLGTALIFHHYNLCNIIHQLFLIHVTNLQDVSVSLFAKNNSRIKLSYHGTNKKKAILIKVQPQHLHRLPSEYVVWASLKQQNS